MIFICFDWWLVVFAVLLILASWLCREGKVGENKHQRTLIIMVLTYHHYSSCDVCLFFFFFFLVFVNICV